MAAPAAKKIEVTVHLFRETLAVVDAIAEVYTNERCDESNPEPFTREDILLHCIQQGLMREERENLGTNTANDGTEKLECDPLDPQDHSDDFTNPMLALLAGARELRARALKLHDRAENTCHDDEWGPTQEEFNRATNADSAARALLDEHKRMVERQWRADQTPAAKARHKKWQEENEREEPERELRGARESAKYAQRRLREVEAKIKRRRRAPRQARRTKAVVEHAHQNGAAL